MVTTHAQAFENASPQCQFLDDRLGYTRADAGAALKRRSEQLEFEVRAKLKSLGEVKTKVEHREKLFKTLQHRRGQLAKRGKKSDKSAVEVGGTEKMEAAVYKLEREFSFQGHELASELSHILSDRNMWDGVDDCVYS
eukprot:GHVN01073669.1.p2 GENE.GHVN01073669.1~~GHVN01073669.1.p2  ORF type:complete len:138 (-),score=21.08 GHVN01073669.1:839-1252(-)